MKPLIRLIHLCFLIGTISASAPSETSMAWVKIPKSEMGNFISTYSVQSPYFLPTMPSTNPRVQKFEEYFDVHEFHLRSDGKAYKLVLSYTDFSVLDTSDIRNFLPAELKIVPKTAQDTPGRNTLMDWQTRVEIDTSDKSILWKQHEGEFYAFKYFYEVPDSTPFKLFRVTGNLHAHLAKHAPNGYGIAYWNGGDTIYKEDPLKYIQAGDTVVVYGTLHEPSGVFARKAAVHVNRETFVAYDAASKALLLAEGEKYNGNFWEIRNSTGRNYIDKRVLCTYIFRQTPTELPSLSCSDPRLDVQWYEKTSRVYHVQVEIPPDVKESSFRILAKTDHQPPFEIKAKLIPIP